MTRNISYHLMEKYIIYLVPAVTWVLWYHLRQS